MKQSWMDKKNELIALVIKVSDQYGGDEPEMIKYYTEDLIKRYKHNLDEAIICFESLLKE